jgi:hypothetical protein
MRSTLASYKTVQAAMAGRRAAHSALARRDTDTLPAVVAR